MPIIELRRLPRSSAAHAAVIGATRALEAAFPVILDEAVPNRLSRAMAALMKMEAVTEIQGAAVAA